MKLLPSVPEEILRDAWLTQRFSRRSLHTNDGKPIVVIDPGQQNHDSGPDFKQARIRIGDVLYCGDVEVHRNAKEWRTHAHDRDPRYNRVILHAVLYGSHLTCCTNSGREIPELVIADYLDESLLPTWSDSTVGNALRRTRRIKCSGLNQGVPQEVIERWVLKLAQQRLEFKVRKFHERLKQLIDESRSQIREPYARYIGDPSEILQPSNEYTRQDYAKGALWDQLIYEGLMEGLGYSKNREPMLTLARNVTLRFLNAQIESSLQDERFRIVQASLFGAAGLLPSIRTIKDKEARSYLRDLRRVWKQIRPQHKGQILHPAEWQFFRLRPQNFPTLRLSAASALAVSFSSRGLLRPVIHIIKDSSRNIEARFQLLRQLLTVHPDAFWSKHYTFHRSAQKKLTTLIGRDRKNDIIMNTFFPISLFYARTFRDLDLRVQTTNLLNCFPAMSENSLTRTMERELLVGKVGLSSGMAQQGIHQLFIFYCKDERCSECDVGKLVFPSAHNHRKAD